MYTLTLVLLATSLHLFSLLRTKSDLRNALDFPERKKGDPVASNF